MRALLLASCTLALAVCGSPAPRTRDAVPPAAGDTLRGQVAVVGSEPGTWVVLRMEGGRSAVTLLGERRLLTALTGLEATVWGVPRAGRTMDVARVEVRASGGVPAVDGVLDHRGGADVLVTHDGRAHPVAHLPDALRGMTGARVWLAGPLDRPPDSFGIIVPPPGARVTSGDTLQVPR